MFGVLSMFDILNDCKKHQLKSPQVPIPLPPWFTENPRAVNELSRGDPSIPDGIKLSVKKNYKVWMAVTTPTRTFYLLGRPPDLILYFTCWQRMNIIFFAVWNFSSNSIFRRTIPILMWSDFNLKVDILRNDPNILVQYIFFAVDSLIDGNFL